MALAASAHKLNLGVLIDTKADSYFVSVIAFNVIYTVSSNKLATSFFDMASNYVGASNYKSCL